MGVMIQIAANKACVIMEEISLKEIQDIELEIASEIDSICRAHNLTYYLAYGSLIGAARNKGFIPWDDDMDIMMMRRDYEILLENFNAWTSNDKFQLRTHRDSSGFCAFAKIVDATTIVKSKYDRPDLDSSIWVDIVPLDYSSPSDKNIDFKLKFWALITSFILTNKDVGSSWFVRLAKRLICPVAHRLDYIKYLTKFENLILQSCIEEKETLRDFACDLDARMYYEKEWFGVTELEFEGRKFFAPTEFDKILTSRYGDWRTPPKESERYSHVATAYRVDKNE